jgi:copper chaperone CopZ
MREEVGSMATVVLTVPDISCEHCERAIRDALGGVRGVQRLVVDIPEKHVRVTYDEALVGLDRMKEILREEGYPVAS